MTEVRTYYDVNSQRIQTLFLDTPSDNLEFVESKDELRAKNPSLVPQDLLFLVKKDSQLFQWDPQATGFDNDINLLQADNWNGVGRWSRVGSVSTGDPGPTGPQGEKGEKGDRGDSFTIHAITHSSQVTDYNDRPANFVVLANDLGTLWIKKSDLIGDWMTPIPFRGEKGEKGEQGEQGLSIQGPQGLQGIQGIQGEKGDKGEKGDPFKINVIAPLISLSNYASEPAGFTFLANDTGDLYVMGDTTWADPIPFRGPQGLQGIQGIQGATGNAGSTFLQGFGAPSNSLGKDTDYYLDSSSSEGKLYRKNGSSWGFVMNLVGPTGTSGSGGSSIEYNPISRYAVVTSTGLAVWVTSSSTFFTGISWQRSGTSMTISQTSHGLSVGDRVIVRNTNVDNLVAVLTSATANDFTIECADSGNTSGTAGALGMGFNFAHQGTAGSITGGVLTAPTTGNVVLLALQIHVAANMRASNTYNVTLPASTTNGAGADTSAEDLYLPSYMVRQDADSLTAVGATIIKNVGGAYNTLQLGGLPAVGAGIYIKLQF